MNRWVLFVVSVVCFVFLLPGVVLAPYNSPSSGMENALYQGDRIIVNKWSYGLRIPFMSLFSYHRLNPTTPNPGDIVVFNNPLSTETVTDRREVYISRCLGIPGDTLLLDTLFNTISGWAKAGPDRKNLYSYPRYREGEMDLLLDLLSIENNYLMGGNENELIRSFSRYEYYLLEQSLGEGNWIKLLNLQDSCSVRELVVPKAGRTVTFDDWNQILYINTIVLHEEKNVETRNDSLFIDGIFANDYTFTKDYFWKMSNNSINMADSRLFGFVPQENLIGKASFIWFSKEPDTGLFSGFRWKRMMRSVK